MITWPFPSNATVTFWHVITGGIKSTTVATALQVLLFPFTSVTVRTSGFGPRFKHVKLLVLNVVEAMPQASEEPLLTAVAVVKPTPLLFN